MTAKRMRVVGADERPAQRRKPLSLLEAVEGGDYLQILLAQRRAIARAVLEEKGQPAAALHRQLQLISKDIEALELAAAGEGSVVAATRDEMFDPSII